MFGSLLHQVTMRGKLSPYPESHWSTKIHKIDEHSVQLWTNSPHITSKQSPNHQIHPFLFVTLQVLALFFFQWRSLKKYLSPPYILSLPFEPPKITQLSISRSLWGPALGFGAQRPRNLSSIQCLGAWMLISPYRDINANMVRVPMLLDEGKETISALLARCVCESSMRILLIKTPSCLLHVTSLCQCQCSQSTLTNLDATKMHTCASSA